MAAQWRPAHNPFPDKQDDLSVTKSFAEFLWAPFIVEVRNFRPKLIRTDAACTIKTEQ